ncbi:MAG: hypothetical protein II832_07275 [Synergistaceae bacterium]|nr:hypothetical protein [Synergistaceae bacterium]
MNSLEGETVAQVYLIADEKPKREYVVRLIAAAPEMYELLRVWVQIQAQPMLRDAQDTARKLLALIDGKEASHE